MYGDNVEAVLYKSDNLDLFFHSTKAGIKVEAQYKSPPLTEGISFFIKNENEYENKENEYISFTNDNEKESIVYKPLLHYKIKNKEILNLNSRIDIYQNLEGYTLTMSFPENILKDSNINYPLKLESSFELYMSKLADTTIYSKFNK